MCSVCLYEEYQRNVNYTVPAVHHVLVKDKLCVKRVGTGMGRIGRRKRKALFSNP